MVALGKRQNTPKTQTQARRQAGHRTFTPGMCIKTGQMRSLFTSGSVISQLATALAKAMLCALTVSQHG
jgi:hypothetical protein